MHPVSYSVVSPYLMSVLGVRSTMMIAGTVSAALTTLILVRLRAVRNPLLCGLAADFALLCNALSGRVTFGLGTMFGLGAVAAVFCWPHRWRTKRWAKAAVAAPLAGLATASSPVAGLFLGVVATALFLNKRRPGAYALGLAPVAVVALSAWLFPFSGTQPMSVGTVSLPLLYGILVLLLVPKKWRTVRTGAAVYSVGVVLTWLIDSQIGSNISRLPMVFAGVVLLAALPYTVPRSRKWYAVVIAFIGLNVWIGFKGVDDVVRTAPAASWSRELAPLVNELQKLGAEKGRVEVVPASSHREASALSPYVNLARGWNRQADMQRNPLFYDDTLDSASYRAWLSRWAVRYVVLPMGQPDSTGAGQEEKLVQDGLPYLKRLWGDENWQLFAVDRPTPMADPPGTVERAAEGELTLRVKKAGRVLIRIPYSPWLGLVDEHGKSVEPPQETEASKGRADGEPKVFSNVNGCLVKTDKDADGDEWTELLAPKPGSTTWLPLPAAARHPVPGRAEGHASGGRRGPRGRCAPGGEQRERSGRLGQRQIIACTHNLVPLAFRRGAPGFLASWFRPTSGPGWQGSPGRIRRCLPGVRPGASRSVRGDADAAAPGGRHRIAGPGVLRRGDVRRYGRP